MAGILGVRACGHAARIRVRQHGGGGSDGGGAVPCPTARHRRCRGEEKRWGKMWLAGGTRMQVAVTEC
jgi:hypothetical protein